MQHIVIDEGSSQIKVCWFDGKIHETVIPSRLVEGARLKDGGQYHDGAYVVDGNEYTVASHFDGAIRTNTEQYQTSEYNRVLVHEALRKSGFSGQDVTVYTTLPISDFFGVKPRNDALIEKKKTNLMAEIENKAGHELARIVDCKVWPEAIPAWLDLLLDEQGKTAMEVDESYKIMIVDIGGTTSDMTIIDGNGSLQEYNSLKKGVFNVAENLTADLIQSTGRNKIEAHQIDKALRDKSFSGNDISKNINQAFAPVVRDIHLDMVKFNSESSNLDAVVYVGGGAALMADAIASLYGGRTIIGDEFSIARGILKKILNNGTLQAA